jgi:glutamine---fructose-6-phosphate transaminase (isomerizing)
MCGIFGFVIKPGTDVSPQTVEKLLTNLYLLSESRGKESAGLHFRLPETGEAWTLKGAQAASELLATPEYARTLKTIKHLAWTDNGPLKQPIIATAHSRLVTNGTSALDRNNQPVRWGGVSIIHNGIIVNDDALWTTNNHLQRHAEVDTEVIAALLDDRLSSEFNQISATREVFSHLRGAASVAWLHDQAAGLTLATNTGDLYFATVMGNKGIVFASEKYILVNALKNSLPKESSGAEENNIMWLSAGTGLQVDLMSSESWLTPFQLGDTSASSPEQNRLPTICHHDVAIGIVGPLTVIARDADESLVRYNEARIGALRRCTRCVLPDTFPFIQFDSDGVCNYCHSYKPRYAGMHPTETRKHFIDSLEKYRRAGKEPDVLVPFSGGRDSSYGLHLIHEEFGLRPVTFTYDWGMVTDLARRNIARMCGQLGIQNILVSADIKVKRENIRKNVAAWLKKPDLGMVPLFMAGDKHFFKVVNQLKKQTGIDLDLWCANPLENTDFKSGFCGVRPDFDKTRVDYLSLGRKAQLAAYYGSRFLTNPGYLNSSLVDTFEAFLAYYFEPRRDFYFIFDHFIWNEDEVNKTLLSTYDWELSPDSPSTWRIGDGTAPFYNYIYMTARGFTEFDTFRSNQIREGMITREQAMTSILVENRPRVESLRWYLATIGLDFDATIKRVNELDVMKLHA